jgi:5-methylcytosine-specific restriction endonuclease McrA
MDEAQLDRLWAEHIGSRRLSLRDEIRILRKLQQEKQLSWRVIHTLYLTSKVWRATRYKVLQRDKNRCVKCGSELFLQVDHIRYPEKIGNEKLKDLQTLCWSCHNAKTEKFDLAANGDGERLKVAISEDQPLYAVLRRG